MNKLKDLQVLSEPPLPLSSFVDTIGVDNTLHKDYILNSKSVCKMNRFTEFTEIDAVFVS